MSETETYSFHLIHHHQCASVAQRGTGASTDCDCEVGSAIKAFTALQQRIAELEQNYAELETENARLKDENKILERGWGNCSADRLIKTEQRSTALGRIVGHKPEQQWIPVSERLPKEGKNVRLVYRGEEVHGYWYMHKSGQRLWCIDHSAGWGVGTPDYWQEIAPLPEPPKESSDD